MYVKQLDGKATTGITGQTEMSKNGVKSFLSHVHIGAGDPMGDHRQ